MINKIINFLLYLPAILLLNGAVIFVIVYLWKEFINDRD
jgi:hypothetical protein